MSDCHGVGVEDCDGIDSLSVNGPPGLFFPLIKAINAVSDQIEVGYKLFLSDCSLQGCLQWEFNIGKTVEQEPSKQVIICMGKS